MERSFFVDEIFLTGVSGCACGSARVDVTSGQMEDIQIESYSFSSNRSDQPVLLTVRQKQEVQDLIESLMQRDPDFTSSTEIFRASAASERGAKTLWNKATDVLARFLRSPTAKSKQRRAGVG